MELRYREDYLHVYLAFIHTTIKNLQRIMGLYGQHPMAIISMSINYCYHAGLAVREVERAWQRWNKERGVPRLVTCNVRLYEGTVRRFAAILQLANDRYVKRYGEPPPDILCGGWDIRSCAVDALVNLYTGRLPERELVDAPLPWKSFHSGDEDEYARLKERAIDEVMTITPEHA